MVTAANTRPEPPARSLYFLNGPADFVVVGGGSLGVFMALSIFGQEAATLPLVTLSASLSWVVNWPHFSATIFRLYRSRDHILQYPVTAIVIPALLVGATAAALASPHGVAPYFVKLYLLWSPYHFAAQSLGLCLLYARRAGFTIGRVERTALSGFIFGTFATSAAQVESGVRRNVFYGIEYPTLGLPLSVVTVAEVGMYVCAAIAVLGIARTCVRRKAVLPPVVLLPAAAQFVWFVPGGTLPSFNEFVPLFHGLQYLLVAWAMQLKERLDEKRLGASPRFVLVESVRWGAANVTGGALLFWGLPHLVGGAGLPLGFAEGIVTSAIQLHHFLVDGVIWKLRNPRVRSPLLVTVDDLLGRAPLAT